MTDKIIVKTKDGTILKTVKKEPLIKFKDHVKTQEDVHALVKMNRKQRRKLYSQIKNLHE